MKRVSISNRPGNDRVYRRLDELCSHAPRSGTLQERVLWFVQLVRWVRGGLDDKQRLRLRYLEAQLRQHPEWREQVSLTLTELVRSWDFEQLLAYGGIARDFHLTGALREWLSFRGLPIACNTQDAVSVLSLAFQERDFAWLSAVELGTLAEMLIEPDARPPLSRALEDALIDLSNQLVAQAHSPSVRNLSRVERSPFAGLNQAIATFLEQSSSDRKPGAVLGRLRQCASLLETYKLDLVGRGADLNTTFQLDRMHQQLKRLASLVKVHAGATPVQVGQTCIAIVHSVTRNTSGRRLIARSSDLLLQNLIETTASVGRDYLNEERSSWRAAFAAGVGGGALMMIATLIKYSLSALKLPTFYEGILFSLNYATFFCAAYLLHFTIATKLPAHTAAALANSVQVAGLGHAVRVGNFLQIWRAMIRLQIAGLLGNVLAAAPLAYLLDLIVHRTLHTHVLSDSTAEHVLHANTLLGPSIAYAALTGVFLWLSSLIGAATDNWTRLTRLVERLATNLWVMRGVGERRARPVAEWFVERAGGLAGNAALGIMLGGVPAFFAIAQLPIDIRHVTVAASSFALAFAADVGTPAELAFAASGVLVIGAVNVSASFALALQFALRANSRGTHGSARSLVKLAIRHWARGSKPAFHSPRLTDEPLPR